MNLHELKEWIQEHRYVTTERDEYDENGNHHEERIYTDKCGYFYIIEFSNNNPIEKWGEHGFIRGEYGEPEEVMKTTMMIERYIRVSEIDKATENYRVPD